MAALKDIVAAYVRDHRPRAARELRWFAIQRTFANAVTLAAVAQGPSGKRLSHQRRIPFRVLAACRTRLLGEAKKLSQSGSFEELHKRVHSIVGGIRGIGELYVYDTALRIGAKLGLEPTVVFMHAGTRTGARNLGIATSRETVPIPEVPRALRLLKPREIEDILCIYKSQLADCRSPLTHRYGLC
jgi:hypothetical protein